jgi:hypothetical protein
MKNTFTKKNGLNLPVNSKYLLPILNKTSKGSKYYESPPNKKFLNRQIGRILLQIHQISSFLNSSNITLKNKVFLDIGSGNGFVPRLLAATTDLKHAIATDPFLDGEHTTSWQKHNRDHEYSKIINYLKKEDNKKLIYSTYKKYLESEHHQLIPNNWSFNIKKINKKKFFFKKLYAHELHKINKKVDIFYAKSLDHISNWEEIFRSISKISKKNTIIYIKHHSFFSYLGPHRYSSTFIPWGHLLLNDKEYCDYVGKFHTDREKQMKNFYFKELTYPRITTNELFKIAQKFNFIPHLSINEPMKNINKITNFINDVPNFWKLIKKNYPDVSSDEVLSGRIHIILKKI